MAGFNNDHQPEIDVVVQDQTTPPFQFYLMREDKDDITLTSGINIGDTVINVSSGHGFTATGEYMLVVEGNLYLQYRVISVLVDAITIQSDSPYIFTTSARVVRGIVGMGIDGSSVQQEFILNLPSFTAPIDLTHAHINITNASLAGDGGTFGDLAALSNGLRFIKINTPNQGLGTFTKNQEFEDFGGEVRYTDKAPGGAFGVSIHFDFQTIYKRAIRLDFRISEVLKSIVRDNLSTLDLTVSVTGHYTLGE